MKINANAEQRAAILAASVDKRKYFTLAVREPGSKWSPQFGDYTRSVVAQEQSDTRHHWAPRSKFKIVASDDDKASIDAAIKALNDSHPVVEQLIVNGIDLVQAVHDHCVANYNNGWCDIVIETKEKAEIADIIAGAKTVDGAVRKIKASVSAYADVRKDVQATEW